MKKLLFSSAFALVASIVTVNAQITPSDTFNQKEKIEKMPTDTGVSKRSATQPAVIPVPDKVIGKPAKQPEMEMPSKQNPHGQPQVMQKKFHCRFDDFTSEKEGNCPRDGSMLIKEGMYYCMKDNGVVSEKPGNCPKCGKPLIEMKKTVENSKRNKQETPQY